MKFTAVLAIGLCLIASTGHAQNWISALGAFAQGVQNGEAQRYNMQHGYPAQIYQPSYGGQLQSQWGQPQSAPYYIFNNTGRTVTCIPLGGGMVTCD